MRNVLKFATFVVIFATAVAGCATAPIPYCERFTAYTVNGPAGPGVFLDLDNVKKLSDTLAGLNDGKCRLNKGAT